MAGYTDIPPSYFDRLIARPGEILADTVVGAIEGGRKVRDTYNAAEGWLDDRYEDVVDFFDRDRYASSGPLARHGYRNKPYIEPDFIPGWDKEATLDNTPSHLIPGFSRMVNEGYDSWSPSDGYPEGATEVVQQDTRSEWQKWKDSVSGGY